MQEEVEGNFDDEYCTIPPEKLIGMLGTLESRYYRRRAACETQKPAAKKKKT